jgi:hypothetical protein
MLPLTVIAAWLCFVLIAKKLAFSALPEVFSIPKSPLNEYGAEKSILA